MLITIAREDCPFCAQIEKALASQQYQVNSVPWSSRMLQTLEDCPPQLLVLVPPLAQSPVKPLRELRANKRLSRVPILCIGPKTEGPGVIAALEAGADDFISRPFSPQIFLARVRTLLRRASWGGSAPADTVLKAGNLELELVTRRVTAQGKPVNLTRLEFDLIAYLLRHGERVHKRRDILEAIWDYPDDVETRTLDKHVETLRKKLGPASAMIQTVHGVGYSFNSLSSNPVR